MQFRSWVAIIVDLSISSQASWLKFKFPGRYFVSYKRIATRAFENALLRLVNSPSNPTEGGAIVETQGGVRGQELACTDSKYHECKTRVGV